MYHPQEIKDETRALKSSSLRNSRLLWLILIVLKILWKSIKTSFIYQRWFKVYNCYNTINEKLVFIASILAIIQCGFEKIVIKIFFIIFVE